MTKKTGDTSQLFGMKLFSSGKFELLTLLEVGINKGGKLAIVFTPNPEQVVQASEDSRFNTYLTQADYLLPDGVGLVGAAQLIALFGKTHPFQEQIPGVDVVADLLENATTNHWSVLVIGGRGYSQNNTISYKNYSLTWTPGYENISQPTSAEEIALAQLITTKQPDIVFVAFGAPYQEQWVIEHRNLLEKSHVKLAMAVGGSFDYLLGKVARAPQWVRSLGLEWLYRLLKQPWRWKRQLRLIRFIQLVGKELVS